MRTIRANHSDQRYPQMEIAATWNFQAAAVTRWTTTLIIFKIFFLMAARQAWGSVIGIFVSTSAYEMDGGFLIFGLCLAASGYGLRLILQTNIAKPNKK